MLTSYLSRPHHVVVHSGYESWLNKSTAEVWKYILDTLEKATHEFDLSLHCFVLMDNHFHLLCGTDEWKLKVLLRVLGDGLNCKFTTVKSSKYYLEVYRYIYRNPVQAGIVSRVEDYQFSSLALSEDRVQLIKKLDITKNLFIPLYLQDRPSFLGWLNNFESSKMAS